MQGIVGNNPCARGIPFVLNIKKAAGTSSVLSRAALRTCRHPPIASLPLKVKHFPMLSQVLLLTKLRLSLPISSLDDYIIANCWLKAQVSIYNYV